MAETEHKFLLPAAEADEWLVRLRHRLGAPRRGYTRTIYLDTDDLHFFRSPTGPRQRVRIREYVPTEIPSVPQENCYLELKSSSNHHRRKARLALPPAVACALLRGETIAPWWQRIQRDPGLTPLLPLLAQRALRPRVCTWYHRSAFERPLLRVTLDEELCFCRPTLPGNPHRPASALQELPLRVLEIKSHGALPGWLAEVVTSGADRRGFSKFEAAMGAAIEYDQRTARTSRPAPADDVPRAPGVPHPCS